MALVAWEFVIARAWTFPSGTVVVDGDLRGTTVGNGEPGELGEFQRSVHGPGHDGRC